MGVKAELVFSVILKVEAREGEDYTEAAARALAAVANLPGCVAVNCLTAREPLLPTGQLIVSRKVFREIPAGWEPGRVIPLEPELQADTERLNWLIERLTLDPDLLGTLHALDFDIQALTGEGTEPIGELFRREIDRLRRAK